MRNNYQISTGILFFLLLITVSIDAYRDERRRGSNKLFLLRNLKHVVKTDAGEMSVTQGPTGTRSQTPMHVGFITMEPRSLFIPQYLDSSLILFIRAGEARLGYIYKDELEEKKFKEGDVYRIPAGSAFYLENIDKSNRLHVICSIDSSESLGWHSFRSFFVGGGTYPMSILAGFEPSTLAAAFNVSVEEVEMILTRQQSGPIVHLSDDSHAPSVWTKFLEQEKHHKVAQLKKVMPLEDNEEDKKPTWCWRKMLISVIGKESMKKLVKKLTEPESYNIYNRKPDFQNDYGWSLALDESHYSPLSHSDISIYLVNLTAGSMMAPHVNPTATEYGIVLRGSGRIQIVYPNGTLAMNAEVTEGDAFWVPRYFPFCQIASRNGPFEFFGFTTSASKNHPQFLVGENSLLQTMRGPEMAAAFGMSEEKLKKMTNAQRESTILPSAAEPEPKVEKMKLPVWAIGNDILTGF